MVFEGKKTAADARLFGVHPATISRLLSRARAGTTLRDEGTTYPEVGDMRQQEDSSSSKRSGLGGQAAWSLQMMSLSVESVSYES
jgi:hypothetical protein